MEINATSNSNTKSDLNEIMSTLAIVEERIEKIKAMVEDYKICKSETSKSVLFNAIERLTAYFKPQTLTR